MFCRYLFHLSSQSYRVDAANFSHVVEEEEALNGKFAQGHMASLWNDNDLDYHQAALFVKCTFLEPHSAIRNLAVYRSTRCHTQSRTI